MGEALGDGCEGHVVYGKFLSVERSLLGMALT